MHEVEGHLLGTATRILTSIVGFPIKYALWRRPAMYVRREGTEASRDVRAYRADTWAFDEWESGERWPSSEVERCEKLR